METLNGKVTIAIESGLLQKREYLIVKILLDMIFEDDIKESLTVLRNGGVILYPTDTIWGLGCDPTNPAAVEKIFRIKSREPGKSLLILVDGEAMR